MVVIALENCPNALRGDLTKWLQEISLGVYVGQVAARVRDRLWNRVCEECKNGRATMVFSARNEQRYDFRVHNTVWEPIDFDGIKLMMRPSPSRVKTLGKKRAGFSHAAKHRRASRQKGRQGLYEPRAYVVIDVETTGLDPKKDEIIEIGAIKYLNGSERDVFSCLIKPERELPGPVAQLTGLTQAELEQGRSIEEAIYALLEFIGSYPLVAHNAGFDTSFLNAALEGLGMDGLENEIVDTLSLSMKIHPGLESYRLESLGEFFGFEGAGVHRALSDARATRRLLMKLIG